MNRWFPSSGIKKEGDSKAHSLSPTPKSLPAGRQAPGLAPPKRLREGEGGLTVISKSPPWGVWG
ncbi:MAG: hypothetical protein A2V46_13585 [Bacteroidetes bacterium RBG_19FT_COMBO_42_7]|nr:MAG: hypothetical protein A2V46_13585 [Bacteroidetes bacterium RBG_19FT_COMBO_42_7]